MESILVQEAREFACKAHKGQVRKNATQLPLENHIKEVAELVEQAGGSAEEIAAAWLHDTVEDTIATVAGIWHEFGNAVSYIVDNLTDEPSMSGMPLLVRKKLQAEKIRDKDRSIKLVKMADQISNVRDVAEDPPTAWDRQKCLDYANGALLIVEECKDASSFLYNRFIEVYEKVIAVHQHQS